MNNNNVCSNKDMFYRIDKEECERIEYYQNNKDDIKVLKEIISKLAIQNQFLLDDVNELRNIVGVKAETIIRLKRTTLDLCENIVDYIDIKKLSNDLKTKNFASKNIEDLLEYIISLRPYKREVKNEEN